MKIGKKKKKRFPPEASIGIIIVSIFLLIIFRGWVYEKYKQVLSFHYVSQGDKKYLKGNLQEAIMDYNHALNLYPQHVRARYNLGNIYSSYEDYYSAIDCYENALNYDPEHLNSRINLGVIFSEELQDYDKAIHEFERAAKTNNLVMKIPFLFDNASYLKFNIASAYYNMGVAYKYKSMLFADNRDLYVKYLNKAMKNYKKSVEIDPNVYKSHHNYALSLHLLGLYNEAMEEYCKAINIEPLNYEAHYNLAILLKDKKMYREARYELEKTGLIFDSKGESDKLRYVFGLMEDVGQRIIPKYNQYGHIIDNVGNSPLISNDITYLNGKVVVTEDIENAVVDNLKSCNYCKNCSPKK